MGKASLVVGCCFLLLLASCRAPGDSGPEAGEGYPLSGTAAGYPGPATVLDAIAWTTEPGPALTGYVVDASGTGTIAADGSFEVTLDALNRPGDAEHMMAFADLGCDALEIEPADARYLVVDRIQVGPEDGYTGTIALASSREAAEGLTEQGQQMVSWFYVPVYTLVEGECPGYGSYDLILDPGWNAVGATKPDSTASPEVDRNSLGSRPTDSWYYVPR